MILSRAVPRLPAVVLAAITIATARLAGFILYHPPLYDLATLRTGGVGIVTPEHHNINNQWLKIALSPQVKVLKCSWAVPEGKVEPPVPWLAARERRRWR